MQVTIARIHDVGVDAGCAGRHHCGNIDGRAGAEAGQRVGVVAELDNAVVLQDRNGCADVEACRGNVLGNVSLAAIVVLSAAAATTGVAVCDALVYCSEDSQASIYSCQWEAAMGYVTESKGSKCYQGGEERAA